MKGKLKLQYRHPSLLSQTPYLPEYKTQHFFLICDLKSMGRCHIIANTVTCVLYTSLQSEEWRGQLSHIQVYMVLVNLSV